MKISQDCNHCGTDIKIEYEGQSYCVFKKNMSETIIIKDEPDNCSFLDENNNVYKSIMAKSL